MTRALNALTFTASLIAASAAGAQSSLKPYYKVAGAQSSLKPYYKVAATPTRALIVASGGTREGAIVQSLESTVTNSALLHVNDPVWRDADVQFDCEKHQVRRKPTVNLSKDRKTQIGKPAASDWSDWRPVAGSDAPEEALLCQGKAGGLTGYKDLSDAQRIIFGAFG